MLAGFLKMALGDYGMKHKAYLSIIGTLVLVSLLFSGCQNKKDTRRQHMRTIGVVITNDVDYVFEELFVYPSSTDEMGKDFIQNKAGIRKIGSYGVTVEDSGSYNILVRDYGGGVYTFNGIPFMNTDHGVIYFGDRSSNKPDEWELFITVYNFGGGEETYPGEYIVPGDAPDHPQSPLKERVEYRFAIENTTERPIRFISMKEYSAQHKGEVELHIRELGAGKTINISGKLIEDDAEITEWVLYLEYLDSDGKTMKSVTFTDPFNPWETKKIVVSEENGKYKMTAS